LLTHPPCPAEDMGKDQLNQEGRLVADLFF
jgi:hypothetical protein